MDSSPSQSSISPWSLAVQALATWAEEGKRADLLLDDLPASLTPKERARCQHLCFGALRHLGRIDALMRGWFQQPPRARLRAVLWAAGFELIEGGADGHAARVVHHAVEQTKTLASPPEARLVNAVVRKLATALAEQAAPGRFATAILLGDYFSHPDWLVSRWLAQYGADATRRLLEWNQTPAPVHVRWRDGSAPPPELQAALLPTRWASFFEITAGAWSSVEPHVRSGKAYVQDPSTLRAVELLGLRGGEDCLDACASPGGKTLALSDLRAGEGGRLVALDVPGPRQDRLRENAAKATRGAIDVVAGDVADPEVTALVDAELPIAYDAVLLDVPCSNTGVMRHRVDVRWRLRPDDIAKHARQQLALLRAGARRVKDGGRIVYSTCSLDCEENEAVVQAFVAESKGRFALESQSISLPWESGCDGAGAFLLRRQ